ncbi:MAG: ABC-F family ATP-binding cassette domain-containing protein [Chloroflexi bacterium]|nr:ABC-F family ATP-binding cassette domain-containing protein [Chloroflexota bacterium]
MLTAHQLNLAFGLQPLLNDISFSINAGERIGLIGPNGCGKTTLLRILTGEQRPDSGHISLTPADLRVGYLAQGLEIEPGQTVGDLLHTAVGNPAILETQLAQLAQALVVQPNRADLQQAYDRTLNRLTTSDIARAQAILAAFDLDHVPPDEPAARLSGGQKTRLALALVLLSDPELLLLDEPTNHLDIGMLEWLEAWLADFPGAALIVSHDRTFLDRTINRILDLDPKTQTLREYPGNYSDYLEQALNEQEKQWAAYKDQTAETRRLRQDAARAKAQAAYTERQASSIRIGGGVMKQKGYKDYQQGIAKKVARKAKARETKLERYLEADERVDRPTRSWQMKLTFDPAHLGRDVLTLEDVAVGYNGRSPLLLHINRHIRAGARIVLTGANGSGKTTLLRTIAGQIPAKAGQVRLGSSVQLGYMSQEQELLDPASTPLDTILAAAEMNQTEARNFLHHFLFSGDDPLRPIAQLSFGERSRLALACLVAQGCNFLLLDEPINHLDIPSRTNFEAALAQFQGTVLAVVHDRYFIERFASEVWVVANGTIVDSQMSVIHG